MLVWPSALPVAAWYIGLLVFVVALGFAAISVAPALRSTAAAHQTAWQILSMTLAFVLAPVAYGAAHAPELVFFHSLMRDRPAERRRRSVK
jgi:hypothetical protein